MACHACKGRFMHEPECPKAKAGVVAGVQRVEPVEPVGNDHVAAGQGRRA
jgi:hypothetical protein